MKKVSSPAIRLSFAFAASFAVVLALAVMVGNHRGDSPTTSHLISVSRQPVETPAAAVSQAALSRLIASASPGERGALKDREVTQAEYSAAVSATVNCIRSAEPDAEVNGPTQSADPLLLDYSAKSTTPDATAAVIRSCAIEHSAVVEQVYRLQQVPVGADLDARQSQMRQCLAGQGFKDLDSMPFDNAMQAAAAQNSGPAFECLDTDRALTEAIPAS